MSTHMMKCSVCRIYTLKEKCICGEKTNQVRPAKYSPEDKYSKYRRMVKKKELKEKDFL
ncbi:RNA-protein complex protein Nop10 [Candidatus Woesearchaeota archaeon]|nr:RNA-protein complex protein Nop10 [Candidatus Woesearchaeota archaeon]